MTETDHSQKTNGASGADDKPFFSVIVHSFFIVPFLIAVFCVLLFTGIHLLTREQRSAYDYLQDIKTGGLTKRWHGAFELSKILANPGLYPKENRFSDEIISVFNNAKNDDPRVRQYLALAMGRAGDARYFQTIADALRTETEGNVPALIYALGMLRQTRAVAVIGPFAKHQDPRIRSIAAAALGNIASPESKEILQGCLVDLEPNVQWGAAVALGFMRDPSGKEILAGMLDRGYWKQFPEVDPQEQNQLIITAINAAVALNDSDLNSRMRTVAETDVNMRVRGAAMAALKEGKRLNKPNE